MMRHAFLDTPGNNIRDEKSKPQSAARARLIKSGALYNDIKRKEARKVREDEVDDG
jgi:hypothetical protein